MWDQKKSDGDEGPAQGLLKPQLKKPKVPDLASAFLQETEQLLAPQKTRQRRWVQCRQCRDPQCGYWSDD